MENKVVNIDNVEIFQDEYEIIKKIEREFGEKFQINVDKSKISNHFLQIQVIEKHIVKIGIAGYVLGIPGYGIEKLPDEISSLIYLEEMNLMDNKITFFPESFQKLNRVKKLFMC